MDALAASYPSMNPYNFVIGNPTMAMDPDGDSVVVRVWNQAVKVFDKYSWQQNASGNWEFHDKSAQSVLTVSASSTLFKN